MEENIEEIGTSEARIHLGRLISRVQDGASVIIRKRHQPAAVLVPFGTWHRESRADRMEADEIAELVSQLEARHADTCSRLQRAFAELEATRTQMRAWSNERINRRDIPDDA